MLNFTNFFCYDNIIFVKIMYRSSEMELNDAKANDAKIEALEKDHETYIYEYFEEIKRQVDLRREEIKTKVDVLMK
jgi:hypothetical protein